MWPCVTFVVLPFTTSSRYLQNSSFSMGDGLPSITSGGSVCMSARFSLGQTVATPGALEILNAMGTSPLALLARHQTGDWGDVPPEDAKENELSVEQGFRILSSYRVGGE